MCLSIRSSSLVLLFVPEQPPQQTSEQHQALAGRRLEQLALIQVISKVSRQLFMMRYNWMPCSGAQTSFSAVHRTFALVIVRMPVSNALVNRPQTYAA
jgi:hypothetical protein